jgi:hypothetical protein
MYQKTNKTEDTNKLTLLAFKIIGILHNTRLATFIKLLETVSKGLFRTRSQNSCHTLLDCRPTAAFQQRVAHICDISRLRVKLKMAVNHSEENIQQAGKCCLRANLLFFVKIIHNQCANAVIPSISVISYQHAVKRQCITRVSEFGRVIFFRILVFKPF